MNLLCLYSNVKDLSLRCAVAALPSDLRLPRLHSLTLVATDWRLDECVRTLEVLFACTPARSSLESVYVALPLSAGSFAPLLHCLLAEVRRYARAHHNTQTPHTTHNTQVDRASPLTLPVRRDSGSAELTFELATRGVAAAASLQHYACTYGWMRVLIIDTSAEDTPKSTYKTVVIPAVLGKAKRGGRLSQ